MVSELSNQTRYFIYREALDVYMKMISSDQTSKIGLCSVAFAAFKRMDYQSNKPMLLIKNQMHLMRSLPELYMYRSNEQKVSSETPVHWWPLEDQISRINALKNCIDMTAIEVVLEYIRKQEPAVCYKDLVNGAKIPYDQLNGILKLLIESKKIVRVECHLCGGELYSIRR